MRAGLRVGATLGLVGALACGQRSRTTSQVRDLTLQPAPAAALPVASPVEVPRPRTERRPRAARPAPRPGESAPPTIAESTSITAVETLTAPLGATFAPPVAPEPEAPRAVGATPLEPGRTVTVIPAGNGPAHPVPVDGYEPPNPFGGAVIIGGGEGCRPRATVRTRRGVAGRHPSLLSY